MKHAKEKTVHIAQIAARNTLLNSFRKIAGVRWWQLKLETGNIEEVSFDSVTAGYKAGVQDRINIKPMTLYCPAINKRNAEKKFKKMVTELTMQGKAIEMIYG